MDEMCRGGCLLVQQQQRNPFPATPTCAGDCSEDPTLAVADGAALCPLPQDVRAADPPAGGNPVGVVVPLSHQHAPVVVTVDLQQRAQNWPGGPPRRHVDHDNATCDSIVKRVNMEV